MEGVVFIIKLRSRGEKSQAAIKAAYKEQFGNTKQFNADAKSAKEFIAEYFQKNLSLLAEDVSMHLWDLYSKNYKLQDYRECRAILKNIIELGQSVKEESTNAKQKKPSPLQSLRPHSIASNE